VIVQEMEGTFKDGMLNITFPKSSDDEAPEAM
jgi:hypothetical protein